ncbi:hypothetical protein C0J45_19934 [Silurus meridionalis]|nr:hypothetical protein C0J45_19934 [Silurus meridionalis]
MFLPWIQIDRNMAWINYIWYNQQRFINHTTEALKLISEQLHATTLMAVQNRFAIDKMLGPDQGVCHLIGEDCCAVISLHTGSAGPLHALLDRMVKARDEMVSNNAKESALSSWLSWLFSSSWLAGLVRIGTTLGIILAAVARSTHCSDNMCSSQCLLSQSRIFLKTTSILLWTIMSTWTWMQSFWP